MGIGVLSREVKGSGREFDRSLSSSAQVKIEWSYTSAPPVYPREVETGACIKQRYSCRYAGLMYPKDGFFWGGSRRTGYSAWTAEPLKTKALLLSLSPRAIQPTAQYNILEDLNPQIRPFCFLDRAFSIMKTKNKPTKCTN